MVITLLNIIRFPSKFYNYLYNYFLLKITNSEFETFPLIVGKIVRRGNGKLRLGNQVKINSDIYINPVGMKYKTLFYVGPNAEVEIGNNVGITNSLFYARAKIILKDNVLIGGGCQLLDNDFHSLSSQERILNENEVIKSAPIIINESAFIGTSVIILKGVTIGARSIVGAGSVVTKSIPDDEIWGGNPAKFIKKNSMEFQKSKALN